MSSLTRRYPQRLPNPTQPGSPRAEEGGQLGVTVQRNRLLIVDDGPAGVLEQLIGQEVPDILALVSSERPRPPGLRRGAWVSSARIRSMLPQDGFVLMRLTSDPSWSPASVHARVLAELMPPAEYDCAAFLVVAELLGIARPVVPVLDDTTECWLRARRAVSSKQLEAAREAILTVNQRWSTWGPGWALSDEVYTRMGMFEAALVCRTRAGEPPVQVPPRRAPLRLVV